MTWLYQQPGIIMHMRPANERRRYNVTSSLIGWAHTQNDLWAANASADAISTKANVLASNRRVESTTELKL